MQGQVGKGTTRRIMSYFDRLIRRILARSLIDHLVRHGFVPVRGVLRDIFAYALKARILKVPKIHALYNYFQESIPDSYSLGNAKIIWLWSYLCKTKPHCIVEMGSGSSTVIFAMYAKKQVQDGKTRPVVISIESEEKWMINTAKNLEKFNLTGLVNFMQCRLMENSGNDNITHGYVIDYEELDKMLDNNEIDLLLIDGPSGGHGRGATLPSLVERLKVNADVFLDDVSRKKEQESLQTWENLYGDSLMLKGVLPLGSRVAWLKIVNKIKT